MLALAASALCLGLMTGCGDEPISTPQAAAPATSSGNYPGATANYPAANPAATTGNVYGTPTSACGQTVPAGTQAAAPQQGATTPQGATTAQAGCGQAALPGNTAQPGSQVKAGMEATIAERKESGLFSKSLKSVTVTVTNNDAKTQTKFLLVAFTKKNSEVEVQYKSLTMSPGGTATFQFSATKDADDAKVELRDSLL